METVVKALLGLPRPAKRMLAMGLDALLCVLGVWLAFCLRLEQWHVLQGRQWWAVMAAPALALPAFMWLGLYRTIFRYAGAPALLAVAQACLVFGGVYAGLFMVVGVSGVPRSVGILAPVIILLGTSFSRLLVRQWLGCRNAPATSPAQGLPRVLVYGAGQAGRQLAAALRHGQDMLLCGFVDDNCALQGSTLEGVRIQSRSWLRQQAKAGGVTDVLLAMPSVSRSRQAQIVDELLALRLHVRTMPGLDALARGQVRVDDLPEVRIEDLLGRDPVAPVDDLLHKHVRHQVVLVTGAGGSIGSELCRQIARQGPVALLLVEWSEFALYAIHRELEALVPDVQVVPLLASVCDEERMRRIMLAWRPDTVYHAAAYKHVPLVEHNPMEGVRNNAIGTRTAARAARECGVRRFVLVSTDKAVRPTNIMGASKRLAEMALQSLAMRGGGTLFSMVRFGNVLGSSGSVVPLFRQQIAAGGPITLTHEAITRYFMTIPEAAQLVIQAGAMAEGGDVFVLDMGDPVRIIDLARRLVALSGRTVRDALHPDGDIELRFTGLRPGEKLYEELLIEDNAQPTAHPRVMKAHEPCPPADEMEAQFAHIERLLQGDDVAALKRAFAALMPGYRPHAEVVDWVHLQRQREGSSGAAGRSAAAALAPYLGRRPVQPSNA